MHVASHRATAVASVCALPLTFLHTEPRDTWPHPLTAWVLLVGAASIPALRRP